MSKFAEKIEDKLDSIFNPLWKAIQSQGSPDEIVERIGCAKQAKKSAKKVLVAYYTRHGSTASIAMEIGDQLCELGFNADVRFVKNVPFYEDLKDYDGFVLGSAIYWSQLTPEFLSFFKLYEEVLATKPVFVFSTCMSMQRDNNMNRKRVRSYMLKGLRQAPTVKPLRLGLFAGNFDYEKNTLPEGAIMGSIFTLTPLEPGDHRDMAKVRSWAKEVASLI